LFSFRSLLESYVANILDVPEFLACSPKDECPNRKAFDDAVDKAGGLGLVPHKIALKLGYLNRSLVDCIEEGGIALALILRLLHLSGPP
jgi:hypothetical protein